MAALAMRPKLLNRISNEKYQEKDKWKIDDIALGPANELLISGHNLEIPTTFISMYKEDSGKYDNRPEINRSFRQPKPGEQLALFLEGNSIIGLKVESSLRMISTKDMIISKMLNWKRSTTCVCFYRGKLYAASSSTNIVNVCSLDSEEKSDIVLSDMEGDCVLEMVVVMENIYVCTKAAGRALVFSMTGSKKLEFENATQSDAMATSICIHERTELVFVLWNNVQIQLYFQMTSQCFHAFVVTEELHKIRVTTKNILVTLNASKCIVSVYDVGEVIEIDELEKNKLLSVEKTHREKSMSHDEENLKDHPANSETNTSICFSSKSASKQSKVEKLPNTKELYMKQLEENENLRRKSDRDIQRLKERTKVPDGMIKETKSQEKKLKDKLEDEKGKGTREERSHVQVATKLKKVEESNTKLEDDLRQLKEKLLAEESISKEVQTSSLKVETKLKKVEESNTKLEDDLRQLKEKVLAEESISKKVQTSSLKLSKKIEELEGIIKEFQSQQEKLKDNLEEEKEKVTREEISRVQAETSRISLDKTKTMLEKEKEDPNKQLAAEQGKVKDLKESLSQNLTAKNNDSMKSSLPQVRIDTDETLDNISKHSIKVSPLDSVQMKQNTKDVERRKRRSRSRSRRRAREMMQSPDSTEHMDTSDEDIGRRKGSRGRSLTRDRNMPKHHSTENLGTPVQRKQNEIFGFTTGLTTDDESTSGYETANVSDLEGMLKPGSASAAKIQHDEPCSTTDPANDNKDVPSYSDGTSDTNACKGDSDQEESLDGKSKLEVCARVSVEGANLQIADTGVSLSIPPGALSEEQTILMKIIPQPCDAQDALKFECNSVVVVELLPNNCRFQYPVSLTLPHCLQLKKEYERNSIDVLISHHEEGFKPKWEILHDAKFNLWKENCTISLHSFCWVTYEIHDKIVEAKRIKLYTAGKKMRLKDRITEVEVGFYPDLPGSGKILELNKDMHLSQRKPYVFLKTGGEPLLINLHKVVPKEWNNCQPNENPKIIPFDSVSISEERSCPFVLERNGDDTDIPLCIFKVGQKGRNEVELTIRPDVLSP